MAIITVIDHPKELIPLPNFWIFSSIVSAFGLPQCGQDLASVEISLEQSGHVMRLMGLPFCRPIEDQLSPSLDGRSPKPPRIPCDVGTGEDFSGWLDT